MSFPRNAGINACKIVKEYLYYVYILASKKNGTLYTGVTDNLLRRVYEHKKKLNKGFTEKYNIDKLVYYELFNDVNLALHREKQIKKWYRQYKINVIEKANPEWNDLFYEIGGMDNMFDEYYEELKKHEMIGFPHVRE